MNWDFYLNFLAAMLAIVNPIGIWPVWSELTNDEVSTIRNRVAFLLLFSAAIILSVFLVTGKYMLQFFSINFQVFKIAGGILLLYTGISMVRGTASQLTDRSEDGETNMSIAKQRFKKVFVPLGIPSLAGPGSITTVVLFGTKASSGMDYVFLIAVIVIAFLVLFMVFLASPFFEKKVDDIVFTVFTRVFGIIVTAIAIQFMVEGLGEIFPILLKGGSVLKENTDLAFITGFGY
ncbi:MAG TPA: MarC family protein [Sunxiuqinia sp.]|nr:MarC family protein [Sunxiuqinia sp.]